MNRRPIDWGRCHLCGAAEIRADSPHGSPTCDGCWPITENIVSMQTAPGGDSLAVCRCGWRSQVKREHLATVQDAKVRLHWRDVIRRKLAEVEAGLGVDSVAREATAAALLFLFLACDLVGLLVFIDTIAGPRL